MASCPSRSTAPLCCCEVLKNFKHYSRRDLSCCFGTLYSRADANLLLAECESSLKYVSGDLSKVKVFGKWHDIPRKQVSHSNVLLTIPYGTVEKLHTQIGKILISQPKVKYIGPTN